MARFASYTLSTCTLLALAACNSPASVGESQIDPQSGTESVASSEGNTAGDQWSVPSDWPKDVAVYPDATVTLATSINPITGESGSAVILATRDTPAAVADYYLQKIVADGWKLQSNVNGGGVIGISATKRNRTLTVMISQSKEQTTITVGVQ